MLLVLEIEHLLGVAYAAIGPDSAQPDWPPQPDRVFSALVAAWAARGGRADEREALEWLEALSPPQMEASEANARPAPTTFVPPNDPETKTVGNKTVMPSLRRRQPRRFPAALPHDPVVRLVWEGEAGRHAPALEALARDVAYVGHSASLTRCRFTGAHELRRPLAQARRRVYPGRLKQLEAAFAANHRPSPGDVVRPPPKPVEEIRNAFSDRWLTFRIDRGDLDLRAVPLAAKALRDCIMSGYGQGGATVPDWVSGHQADGAPSRDPHLALVPLANAGWEYADGALLGFAVVPPRGRGDLLLDDEFRRALGRLAAPDTSGRRVLRLAVGKGLDRPVVLDLALTLDIELASLDPHRYTRPSKRWATVTPVVLDRHLKAKDGQGVQAEIEGLAADACERVTGVRPTRVVADKHAAVRGAPSAYPSGGAPRWTGWRTPQALRSRRLTHAMIEFAEPVAGPMLIGAGRFCGLGLCLSLDPELDAEPER